ncbi:MAG: paraquat-inducible protein A, partial [Bacteroidota bacterium]|nr:paraquat-inducible protein A [Bacteroidota bacterium]
EFHDQVLFHQSKSILQVVGVLLKERKPELMLVAVLIFGFSVLVPAVKMILSMFTLIRGREIPGKVPAFLMYRAGKWSMADVMVVAIFMAFIGFNGVVNSQLATLEEHAGEVHVLTTNNSALEIGFYMFTAYCLIGLISAALLKKALIEKKPGVDLTTI